MLHTFPGVRQYEQTADVLQNATLRLLRALQAERPGSVREFFALAGTQLRRELLDLKAHYFGPLGVANYQVVTGGGSNPDPGPTPEELNEWTEFHRQIDQLPDHERAVVDLHFYQGLSKVEAAEILGVDARTVQRRWNAALGRLNSVRRGEWPSL
jgi:RNA polymerase sigma factor (sigma-70 family)